MNPARVVVRKSIKSAVVDKQKELRNMELEKKHRDTIVNLLREKLLLGLSIYSVPVIKEE